MELRSVDWLGHSKTLMCFFSSHSFVALAVFWVIVMLEYPSTTDFQCPGWLQYPGPDIPLMWCSCPVPLAEKHPQSIMFPPPCLTVGWCSWGHRQHSSSSKHGELSWCQRARFWSHLTTELSHSSPLNHSDVHWQISDGPVHVLSWAGRPCGHCRISVLLGVVLPIVFLLTMVPATLRMNEWMNGWCIYIALYYVLLYIQSASQSYGGGVSPQPQPVCSIHLDDGTATPGQRCQCAHHTPATGGEKRES